MYLSDSDPGYQPPRRERLTRPLDAFRPPAFEDLRRRKPGEPCPKQERVRDVMHLLRRLSKTLRAPGTQGLLTGQREKCLRVILASAASNPTCRPTYEQIQEATPCSCDVVRDTLHVAEVVGVLRITNYRTPGKAENGPNSYEVAPVPSRSCPVACAEWVDTKAALLRELQAAQDREIVRVACGLHGLRWLALWRLRSFRSWVDGYEDRVRQRAREEGREPEAAVQAARERSRVRPLSPSHARVLRGAYTAPRGRCSTEPPLPRIARLPEPPLFARPPEPPRTIGPESVGAVEGSHTESRSEIKVYDSINTAASKPRRPAFDPAALRAWALEHAAKTEKRDESDP